MTTQMGADLIESYLRTRHVRYFRGHHDDEFFFLVNAYHGRLHVHLEPSGPDRESVTIRVTAERYYPAAERAAIASLAGIKHISVVAPDELLAIDTASSNPDQFTGSNPAHIL